MTVLPVVMDKKQGRDLPAEVGNHLLFYE